jgi:thiol-disulfide isomerase/thioredoxin
MTPMRTWMRFVRLAPFALLATTAACDRGGESSATTKSSVASPPSSSSSTNLVGAPIDGIRWTQSSGSTDVAASVKVALAQAHADGRTLLVYVGATWCEPCQRFHHAVEQGELDGAFPRLSILGFDADRDGTALGAAGYTSRLIPLFALPRDDGRASGKQIEGSVKGEAAVSEITPRLRSLVNGS